MSVWVACSGENAGRMIKQIHMQQCSENGGLVSCGHTILERAAESHEGQDRAGVFDEQ